MNRYQAALGFARRSGWVVAAAALAVTAFPPWRAWAASLLLGMLVGMLNLQLLTSGLRRVLGLRGGAAQGAFQAASFVRLCLMAGILLWAAGRGLALNAVSLLVGVFLPQGLFWARWYAGGGESER